MDFEAHDQAVIEDLKKDLEFAKRMLHSILREAKKNKPNPDRLAQLCQEALDRID